MNEKNESTTENKEVKTKQSPMGWIVSAITVVILLFTLWAGGEVTEREFVVDNETYLVSQRVEPGIKDIVDEIKNCNFNEKDECEFQHSIDVKIRRKEPSTRVEESSQVEKPDNVVINDETNEEEEMDFDVKEEKLIEEDNETIDENNEEKPE